MLFGRENEYKALEKLYKKNTSDAVVVYGNTTNHINEIVLDFIGDKDYFYYNALPVSADLQQTLFCNEMLSQMQARQILGSEYSSVLKAMLEVKCEKRIIVISDFQNIVKTYPEFMEDIIKCINNKWSNQKVLFILVSENSYFVEHQLVDKIMDYAYELSGLIKIKDISFIDFVKHFKNYSFPDLVSVYSIIGGRSKYISHWDVEKTVKYNICENILNTDSYLFKHGFSLLPEELREPQVYNTILLTIASGKEKLNDIHKATGYSRAKISVYLNNLSEFDIVEKIDSFDTPGKDNALKGIYRIKDRYVSFYYKFVFPHISEISTKSVESVYKIYIEKELISFSQDAFRTICLEYLTLLNNMGRLPFNFNEFGTFLGKVGNIDIVASDSKGNNLIGLCNWENEVMTLEDYEWLTFCAKQAKLSDDVYYLFTRVSFDEKLKELASLNKNIYLIDSSML